VYRSSWLTCDSDWSIAGRIASVNFTKQLLLSSCSIDLFHNVQVTCKGTHCKKLAVTGSWRNFDVFIERKFATENAHEIFNVRIWISWFSCVVLKLFYHFVMCSISPSWGSSFVRRMWLAMLEYMRWFEGEYMNFNSCMS